MCATPHRINMEVRVEGREPYQVLATFDVPNKFSNIARGLELPVVADAERPERVTIDWDAFEAAGGVEKVRALGDRYKRDAVREVVSHDPVQRAAAIATVEEWLGVVKAEQMTMGDFAGYVDGYVEGGYLSADEGEAAKRRAAEPVARPTPEAYLPVEGVDYETWIAAIVGMVRAKTPRSGVDAYYDSCGFPAGRGEQISAVWYARVQADDDLRATFMRDTATR